MTDEKRLTTEPLDVAAIVGALRDILVGQLGVSLPVEQLDENASLEDLGVDSIVLVELVGAVETRFNFVFLDSDLRTSTFENLRALAEVVAERIRVSVPASSE